MSNQSETARVMAKNWRRGDADTRRNIELAITRRNMWHLFKRSPRLGLVAAITEEDQQRTLGASCRGYSNGFDFYREA